MANKAITFFKRGTDNTQFQIIDTAANIDALWTLSQVLVGGFADFTSVANQKYGYARKAVRYSAYVLDQGGSVVPSLSTIQTAFDAGLNRQPNHIGPPIATDGTATLVGVAKAVDDLQSAVVYINSTMRDTV